MNFQNLSFQYVEPPRELPYLTYCFSTSRFSNRLFLLSFVLVLDKLASENQLSTTRSNDLPAIVL